MKKNKKIESSWNKVKDTFSDALQIGSREVQRSVKEAKKQISKFQLIQRRKELFAELGRCLYEMKEDGLPADVQLFLRSTELGDIMADLEKVDHAISRSKVVKKQK